jgi:hypothetical protein
MIFINSKGIYRGHLKNDKPHGFGIMKFKKGKKYEGEWFEGRFHGQGVLTLKDETFSGEFKNGVMEGNVICKEKDCTRIGYMLNGEWYGEVIRIIENYEKRDIVDDDNITQQDSVLIFEKSYFEDDYEKKIELIGLNHEGEMFLKTEHYLESNNDNKIVLAIEDHCFKGKDNKYYWE